MVSLETVNQLVNNTFNGYNCLNFYYVENTTYKSEEIYHILQKIQSLNFSLLLINSIKQVNENCGIIFINNNNSNEELLKSLQHYPFEEIVRMLYISGNETEILQLIQDDKNLFENMDVLLAIISHFNITIFMKSRYNSDFQSTDNNNTTPFFHSKTFIPINIDYNKKIFKLSTFHCPVFGSVVQNELTDGVETRIYKQIEEKFNFSTEVFVPNDGKRWGEIYENGTVNGGILKALHESRTDIGFCSLWIERKRFNLINMSTYWGIQCLKFLIPKPKILSTSWYNILKPLPNVLWVLILVAAVVTSSFCSFLRYIRGRLFTEAASKTNINAIVSDFITIFGILVLSNPRRTGNEHLFLWWSVFALVMATLYSSSLVSHLTYPQFESMIESTEGLVKAGYYWGTPYEAPVHYVFDLQNEWNMKFANRFNPEVNPGDRVNRIRAGNYSIFVKSVSGEHYMEIDEIPLDILYELRTTKTCVNYYLLGFGYRKALSLTRPADRVIRCLVETGIIGYWLDRLFEGKYPPITFKKVFEYKIPPEDVKLTPLSVDNLQGAFAVLLVGIICSVIAFIREVAISKLEAMKCH